MVWEEDNQLHYYVARLPLIMSPLSPDSTDHIQQSIPPSECWGMWIRVPDQVSRIFENQVSVSHTYHRIRLDLGLMMLPVYRFTL